jgi:molecular chaperone HscC
MILGIDLGTTNSAVSIWRDGRAELIPNSLGYALTPSAVSVDEHGQILVGLSARERQSTHPQHTATAFKRYMGTRKMIQLGEREFLPEELSALVLGSLKADAEAFLGQTVDQAVITVPAYFNDKQRKATRRAGELAGFKVERLLNEPTAAALAYGIHELGREARFLVFDLGGGTFDVSVLDLFEGVIEVRASTGDNHLGGEDFNELLVDSMYKAFAKQWKQMERPRSGLLYERMRIEAERVRRELSSSDSATMKVIWSDQQFEHAVDTEQFEKLAEPLLQRLRTPVMQALKDGNIRAEQLDAIVMVGGATRMPIVKRAVTKMFGRFPETRLHPDEAIALGAAVQAGLKSRDAALKEIVLTDVCPYTLGIAISERLPGGDMRHGIFAPIIERNTLVPASRAKPFSTMQDGQAAIQVQVYQGEARHIGDNIHLGNLEVPVPRKPAGHVTIECRFSYDINGLLEVDVKVNDTGEQFQLVILDDKDSIAPKELEQRRQALQKLKIHPREQEANRAALSRGERCYEQALSNQREIIGQWISQFENVLAGQNSREINPAREAFLKALDSVEGQTFL